MKKDLSNIIKNVQNTDIPPFPLDNSELTSVLDRVDRKESSGNSKLFTKRGIKMTSIITSILMLGIFGINYLSNDPQPATVNKATAKVKQENTAIEEKGNKDLAKGEKKKQKEEIIPKNEIGKIEIKNNKYQAITIGQEAFDIARYDTMPGWEKLGYDNYSNKFFFSKQMYFSHDDTSKDQHIEYYEYIENKEALIYYKELFNELHSLKVPNLDKIGFVRKEDEFNKLHSESVAYIQKMKEFSEYKQKYSKFVMLSSIINNKPSSINIMNLDQNELRNIGVNYGDSSISYITESYIDDFKVKEIKPESISKYKESPKPALMKHRIEIFWKFNPRGKGAVVMTSTDSYDASKYDHIFEYRNEKSIFIHSDSLLPYESWGNTDFCKTCPILTGTGKNIKYEYSPLTYSNPLFKEYFSYFSEAQLMTYLLKEVKDSLGKSLISETQNNRFAVQTYQDRKLMNYLIPVEIMMPYKKSTDSSYDQISEILWYLPTKEFVQALPERYRNVLIRELKAIELIESGKMMPEEACKGLSVDETFFELCKLSSESVKDINVFPNPFNDNGKIKFFLLNDRIVNMTIHDVSGNYIKTLVNWEKLQKGEQTIDFDMKGLQSGTYIINVSTDNSERVNKRFVKL